MRDEAEWSSTGAGGKPRARRSHDGAAFLPSNQTIRFVRTSFFANARQSEKNARRVLA